MRALGIAALAGVLALAVLVPLIAGAGSTTAIPVPAATYVGAEFTSSNSAAGNQVIAYERNVSGGLTWVGNFSTGGIGTGASLADSGSLAITADHHWLLVVDAGSNQLSVFHVNPLKNAPLLTWTDTVASGGVLPVSIAIHGHLVYAVNGGSVLSQGNIAGFWLTNSGLLNPLAGSTEPLSTPNVTGAAEVSFTPNGTVLAVTEKSTNLIDTYTVNSLGQASPPTTSVSAGTTPYGFAFDSRGVLIVSEAASGSLSSYSVDTTTGSLTTVSRSVTDLQGAPCWVATAGGSPYAFTSNTASDTISSYEVGSNGTLTLLQAVATTTGGAPGDLAVTGPGFGHYLSVRDASTGDIEEFHLDLKNGTLSWVATVPGLPTGAEGLVAI